MNYIVYLVTGSIAVLFFALAGANGLKRYIKSPILTAITKRHQLFGMISGIAALGHMFFAFINADLRISGMLALLGLFATGMTGGAFSQSKDKRLYLLHRIAGPVTAGFILLHVIVNANW